MLRSQRRSTFNPAGLSAFPIYRELFWALEPWSTKIPCDEDRTLFQQGDLPVGVYLVRSGHAEAIVLNDRDEPAARFQVFPGTVLGIPAILSNEPYSLLAIARRGADVGFVTKEQFDNLVQTRPRTQIAALKVLALEVQLARRALGAG